MSDRDKLYRFAAMQVGKMGITAEMVSEDLHAEMGDAFQSSELRSWIEALDQDSLGSGIVISCYVCGRETDDYEAIRDEISGEDRELCVSCWQHAYEQAFGDEG